jgi:aminoglycoside phosphotransferase family enzyme/predicted kinase
MITASPRDTAAADDPHRRRARHAEFRFYEELNDFLPANRRKRGFDYRFSGTPSVRDAIQALGVPQAEVDLVLVDGVSVDFAHRLHGGERVAVYPVFERLDITPLVRLRARPLRRTRFLLDTHLGKLARYLRMMGFDAAWCRDADHDGIIRRALDEGRIILTRDVGLLKQARVTHGYWVRHELPEEQLEEVMAALDLAGQQKPFSRCMNCNGELRAVRGADGTASLDPAIRARFDAFWRCAACGQLYWRGSHYRRMRRLASHVASRALVRGLGAAGAYPHATRDIGCVETHISWVLLTGDYAYKVKKPVRLGFLDFSTLERRRRFCIEELRVNRRTAPDLYLDVVPIGRGPDGIAVGLEPALEYAVKMRQFPHAARLDRRLQRNALSRAGARELAATVARFHGALPARTGVSNEPRRTTWPAIKNFRHIEPARFDGAVQGRLAGLEAWTEGQAERLRETILQRAADGHVRECHGDLHLENIVWLDGRFVLFDAIEFNPELRWIDTANDIAFLVMDLAARRRGDLAFDVLNAWLEDTGDYAGLAVMRFYLVYRSMVRAVVAGIRQAQAATPAETSFRPAAERYIDLAAELADPPPPRLLLMHGFSGSGKSWLSERLVGALPALRVRSDLERKRLAGPAAGGQGGAGIDAGLYAADVTAQTYKAVARHCAAGLRAGFSMIADATFLRRDQRQRFIDLAAELGVPVGIALCEADRDTLRQRIRQRRAGAADPSDADLAVLEHQLRSHEPLSAQERRRLQVVEAASVDAVAAWFRR